MKSYVLASTLFAALCIACTSAQSTSTSTPTPDVGPSPGTLGASDVAGIPVGPTPTSDSSSTTTTTTPTSVKPGAIGSSTAATGSFDLDGSKDDSLSDLGDQSDDGSGEGTTSKSTTAASSSGAIAEVKTPAPTPKPTMSGAQTMIAGPAAIATFAAVAVSYLL